MRERQIAAIGLASAAGWTTVVGYAPGMPWLLDTALLAAALGYPASRWWGSRRRPAAKLSPAGAKMLTDWEQAVAGIGGPKALQGSVPIRSTVREPAAGTLSMIVQLDGVHGDDARSPAIRKAVEVALDLPANVVQLAPVRDSATQLQVTLAPARHLEAAEGVTWPGPELHPDGSFPVAETDAGVTVLLRLWNQSGVEHIWINGAQGGGKSCTSFVVMLPGVMAGKELILYCDGGYGTSLPAALRTPMTRIAANPAQWKATIAFAHEVMLERMKRRGAAGRTEWVMDEETDPIITLWLEEATEIGRHLSTRYVKMVESMLEKGRKLGIRIAQVTQGARADLLIGGVPARANMTTVIAHRPGSKNSARLAMDGLNGASAVDLDLMKLPPQEGWAAIVRKGQVLGYPARVRWATHQAIAEAVADFTPLELTGSDLAAAGPAYHDAWKPAPDTTAIAAAGEGAEMVAVNLDKDLPESDGQVIELRPDVAAKWAFAALKEHGPNTVAALTELPGAPSRPTIYRALNRLLAKGRTTNNGGTWQLALSTTAQHDPANDPTQDQNPQDGDGESNP